VIVAIHQPNLLPWLGYFYKLARADRFVFLDGVPFAKGSYTNRVQVKAATGPQWLTVPVLTKGKLGQPIVEVACNENAGWRKKMMATLETNYRRCPHYQPYADGIRQVLSAAEDRLAEINIRLIRYVAEQLDIATATTRSSQMPCPGKATDLLIALCKELGAETYLSGSGGANYQDEIAFRAAGIELIYANYQHPTYPQAFGPFAPGLSIVDLLFNCGPDSAAIVGV
jgi:hypothetical protein